jgi:hypothetical protein
MFHGFPREGRVRVIAVLVSALFVAGCSIPEKIAARNEADKSADNYKQCMAANATTPQRCEELRLALEASERKRDSIDTDLKFKAAEPDPNYGHPR